MRTGQRWGRLTGGGDKSAEGAPRWGRAAGSCRRWAIYELVYGAPNLTARYRTRIAKPVGIRYETFQPSLVRTAEAGGALWKRQMVLGPDFEFLMDDRGIVSRSLREGIDTSNASGRMVAGVLASLAS